ncbi:leucine-rich repeat domain-containing protein [candidate division KSB1 bacterium]
MKFSLLRLFFISAIAIFLFLINCVFGVLDVFFEPASDSPIANAGPDQTCKVGEYIFLDGTASFQGKGGRINWWEWEYAEDSPRCNYLPMGETNSTGYVGFDNPGTYTIFLTLKDVSGNISKPDTMIVEVYPREKILFEDPNLEICIRWSLEKPNGDFLENELTSITYLKLLNSIKNDVISLNGIYHCGNLEHLHAPLQNISNISDLGKLTKLTKLVIDQQRVLSDITPLSGLTNLEHLDLNDNIIEDISPLAGMEKLEYLDLRFNHVKDISCLENLVNLKLLWFVNGEFGEISSVRNMLKLERLKFHQCKVSDISALKDLKNLVSLEADLNSISDISPLAELENLKVLMLGENIIEDISSLENLTNLNHLRLWGNMIKDLGPLVRNDGIGKGDILYIKNNPLSERSINEYIPALRQRGVEVEY